MHVDHNNKEIASTRISPLRTLMEKASTPGIHDNIYHNYVLTRMFIGSIKEVFCHNEQENAFVHF
jgi:hypothetical protein